MNENSEVSELSENLILDSDAEMQTRKSNDNKNCNGNVKDENETACNDLKTCEELSNNGLCFLRNKSKDEYISKMHDESVRDVVSFVREEEKRDFLIDVLNEAFVGSIYKKEGRKRVDKEENKRGEDEEEAGESAKEVKKNNAINLIGTNKCENNHICKIKNANLNKINENFNEKNENLNERNATLNEKNENLNERNATLNERNATLNEKNENFNERNANLNERNATLNEKNENLNERNANLNETKANLNEKNANLNEKNANLNETKANLNEKNANLNEKNANLNEKNANLNETRANLNDSHNNIINGVKSNYEGDNDKKNSNSVSDRTHSKKPNVNQYNIKCKTEYYNDGSTLYVSKVSPPSRKTVFSVSTADIHIENHNKYGCLNYGNVYYNPSNAFSMSLQSSNNNFVWQYSGGGKNNLTNYSSFCPSRHSFSSSSCARPPPPFTPLPFFSNYSINRALSSNSGILNGSRLSRASFALPPHSPAPLFFFLNVNDENTDLAECNNNDSCIKRLEKKTKKIPPTPQPPTCLGYSTPLLCPLTCSSNNNSHINNNYTLYYSPTHCNHHALQASPEFYSSYYYPKSSYPYIMPTYQHRNETCFHHPFLHESLMRKSPQNNSYTHKTFKKVGFGC